MADAGEFVCRECGESWTDYTITRCPECKMVDYYYDWK